MVGSDDPGGRFCTGLHQSGDAGVDVIPAHSPLAALSQRCLVVAVELAEIVIRRPVNDGGDQALGMLRVGHVHGDRPGVCHGTADGAMDMVGIKMRLALVGRRRMGERCRHVRQLAGPTSP